MNQLHLYIRLLVYSFSAFVVIVLLYIGYYQFLRDRLMKYTENRVRTSIVSNYHNNKEHFRSLVAYSKGLGAFKTINFTEGKKISCSLHSDSINFYNSDNNISYWIEQNPGKINAINLLPNQSAEIQLGDMTTILPIWEWDFEGGEKTLGYQFVMDWINLKNFQIDSLRILIQNIDCEAISTGTDKDIYLRFDGREFYQYMYIVSDYFDYTTQGYTRLDTNIYCGLFRSELACGRMWWEK